MEETRHAAVLSAEVTHNHPEGIKGAESTAAAIFMARTGGTKEQIKEYGEVGGAPNLDGLYTVFGEVSEGMDVVEAISLMHATGKNGRPEPDVKIIRAYVIEENP